MLYDFHRSQNAKRPGAVHATYLVFGTKKDDDGPPAARNGGDVDVEMTSSAPEAEQPTTVVPTSTLSLVPEEQLEGCLLLFLEPLITLLTGIQRPLRTMRRSLLFTSTA
jgi:DNA polymerase delta subunit 3